SNWATTGLRKIPGNNKHCVVLSSDIKEASFVAANRSSQHVCNRGGFFCLQISSTSRIMRARLLTTEQIMAVDTKSMAEAWSLWDRIWADDRVVFVPEPEDIEKEFRARSRKPSRSPKVWADAYMLAFTAVAG